MYTMLGFLSGCTSRTTDEDSCHAMPDSSTPVGNNHRLHKSVQSKAINDISMLSLIRKRYIGNCRTTEIQELVVDLLSLRHKLNSSANLTIGLGQG